MEGTFLAPAKLNLHLSVFPKESDGYHPIESIMQLVSLYDELKISIKPGYGIKLTVLNQPQLSNHEDNLVYKAVQMYLERFHLYYEVEIILTKNIPMGAGLGGGSSDAATAIKGLNTLLNGIIPEQELLDLCYELGSDVPFCFLGGTAFCSHHGEIMTPLESNKEYYYLIASSNEQIDTKKAYSLIDSTIQNKKTNKKQIINSFNNHLFSSFYNDFEKVILPTCPIATKYLRELSDTNCLLSLMSGSGSSVFAMYNTQEEALNAQKNLSFTTYLCSNI